MDIEIRIPVDPTGSEKVEATIHCDCSVTIKEQQQDTIQKVILTYKEMDALVSAYQARRNNIV